MIFILKIIIQLGASVISYNWKNIYKENIIFV